MDRCRKDQHASRSGAVEIPVVAAGAFIELGGTPANRVGVGLGEKTVYRIADVMNYADNPGCQHVPFSPSFAGNLGTPYDSGRGPVHHGKIRPAAGTRRGSISTRRLVMSSEALGHRPPRRAVDNADQLDAMRPFRSRSPTRSAA